MQTPYTFAPVALSSLDRVAFFLDKDVGLGRVAGVNADTDTQRRTRRSLSNWLYEVSGSFQNYCQREFLIQSRVQYFDVMRGCEFFPSAVPIVSISEMANDPLGLWTGGQWVLSQNQDYHIGQTGRSVMTTFNILVYGLNSMRLTYTGGMAYSATQSTFTTSGETGTGNIIPGRYAYGNGSEAIGKVISFDASTHLLVMDSIAGVFINGESLTFQPDIYSEDISSTSAVIANITKQSFVEAYPDIAQAINGEIRFMEKHEFDYENISDGGKWGATRRPLIKSGDVELTFQPETLRVLDNYRRYLVGT